MPRGDGASMIEGYFLAGRSQASNFANISSIFDDDLYSVRYQQQALTVGSGRGPLSGSLLDLCQFYAFATCVLFGCSWISVENDLIRCVIVQAIH